MTVDLPRFLGGARYVVPLFSMLNRIVLGIAQFGALKAREDQRWLRQEMAAPNGGRKSS